MEKKGREMENQNFYFTNILHLPCVAEGITVQLLGQPLKGTVCFPYSYLLVLKGISTLEALKQKKTIM